MAKTEVATTEQSFNLATLSSDIAEAMAEEMDGLGTIPFDRVKIPSGGGIAFEVPGEDEDNPDIVKELIGVILYHHPCNAYWENKFEGGNESPDCSSVDGKVGIVRETGEIKDCEKCPYNQFGSDPNGGKGKACKNIRRVYMLLEGNPIPVILSLPPTSIKGMSDYIGRRIVMKGFRSYGVITKITLKKETSATGIAYSKAAFAYVGKLTPEQTEQASAMAEEIKKITKKVAVSDDDYATAPKADADGFMEVPAGNDDELPFN